MANHTIDCPYCYKDQRVHGEDCCKDAQEARRKRWAEEDIQEQRRKDTLVRYGLPCWIKEPHLFELVYRLEAMGDTCLQAIASEVVEKRNKCK